MEKMLGKIGNLINLRKILELDAICKPFRNEDGSILVITLMVLVTITIIGLMSSDSVVTEKFIIRNQAIYKQNLNMVDAVLMESLQRIIQWPSNDMDIKNPITSPLPWINDKDASFAVTTTNWYAINSGVAVLNAANSMAINTPQNLVDRGEVNTLRVAFVGWDKFLSSLTLPSKGVWKGRLLAEYVSRNYGIMRMEIGIRKTVTSL